MTPSVPDPKNRGDRCDSLNVEYLVIDGDDGNTNFTPPSPALIRLLEAEREKLRRWGALKEPVPEQPPAGDSAADQGTA